MALKAPSPPWRAVSPERYWFGDRDQQPVPT